jgi:hypothetical protein
MLNTNCLKIVCIQFYFTEVACHRWMLSGIVSVPFVLVRLLFTSPILSNSLLSVVHVCYFLHMSTFACCTRIL